jgi:hypothetical protein
MLAWIVVLVLVLVEAVAIRWWLASRYIPFFFNDWAAFIYSLLLLVDIAIGWYVSTFTEDGGTPGMQILFAIGVAWAAIVGLGSIFFRWAIHLDMNDISKRDK